MSGRDQPRDPASSPKPGDGSSSVRDGFASFADGLRQYLLARGELLAIEAREATRVAGRKGTLAFLLATAVFFGYALLLVAAVALVGQWLGGILPGSWSHFGWQTAAVLAGLLHLAMAALCYRALRQSPREPLFEVTRSEFQKDRQWLDDQQTNSENRN